MSQQTNSILDNEPFFTYIKEELEAGRTNADLVRSAHHDLSLLTSETAIRRFRKRHNIVVPGQTGAFTKIKDNDAEAQTPATTTPLVLDDPDTMLRERGLDPTEWVITHMSPNMYEGPAAGGTKVTYYQTKFSCKRKVAPELQIFAPRTDGWKAPEKVKPDPTASQLFVVVGDQQAPYHDKELHTLFLSWLKQNKPERGISLGDSVDFPDISRHPLDPENTATVNECLQAGYDIFRGYVDASPNTQWTKLIGNHDERIRNLLLNQPKTNALHGIKRPDTPEEDGAPILDLRHVMRLDELGIDVVDPHGKYDLAQVQITPKLAVRHGWLARSGSGASALASMQQLGYSIIVGHTHRQAVVHHTKHEIDGNLRTLTGVEAGCMCRVSQVPDPEDGRIWPNYTVAPDWQQGFCTVEVYPDGFFSIDTAKYVNGTLLWRGQKYTTGE